MPSKSMSPVIVFTILALFCANAYLWNVHMLSFTATGGETITGDQAHNNDERGTDSSDITNNFKLQTFVISMRKANVEECVERNHRAGLRNHSTTWFPATNGFDQKVLDEWYAITRTKWLNVSDFPKGSRDPRGPHAVGCYFSHWHALRLALEGWRAVDRRPDALLILEDDATCVDDTIDYIASAVPHLPKDWELFFVGGKPFSYFDPKFEVPVQFLDANTTVLPELGKDPKKFSRLACQGAFGKPTTGPYSLDGSRNIDPDRDSFWKVGYVLNTHAYVVNPLRVEHLLTVVGGIQKHITPIDVIYANAMRNNRISAYMPTREYCQQNAFPPFKTQSKPNAWEGYYHHAQWGKRHSRGNYKWDHMWFPNCTGYAKGLF